MTKSRPVVISTFDSRVEEKRVCACNVAMCNKHQPYYLMRPDPPANAVPPVGSVKLLTGPNGRDEDRLCKQS